jgi:acyl-CoA thioester hydrolase
MTENPSTTRDLYQAFYPITTRWADNDTYGHVNNVTYYSYFDSAVNRYLIEEGKMDIHASPIVAFVVNSQCHYLSPIAYPDAIEVGIYVKKLGNSSVTYGVAIFKSGEKKAVAYGDFVHVFVEREHNRSVSIPDNIRSALMSLQ